MRMSKSVARRVRRTTAYCLRRGLGGLLSVVGSLRSSIYAERPADLGDCCVVEGHVTGNETASGDGVLG